MLWVQVPSKVAHCVVLFCFVFLKCLSLIIHIVHHTRTMHVHVRVYVNILVYTYMYTYMYMYNALYMFIFRCTQGLVYCISPPAPLCRHLPLLPLTIFPRNQPLPPPLSLPSPPPSPPATLFLCPLTARRQAMSGERGERRGGGKVTRRERDHQLPTHMFTHMIRNPSLPCLLASLIPAGIYTKNNTSVNIYMYYCCNVHVHVSTSTFLSTVLHMHIHCMSV